MADELEEFERPLMNFLAVWSHDLRTPLATINGFSKMVLNDKEEQLTDRQRKYMGYVVTAVENLNHMLNELRNLGEYPPRSRKIEPAEVDLRALAQEAAESLLFWTRHKKKEIHFGTGDSAKGWADPNFIRLALRILLIESLKFTLEGGAITVDVSTEQASNCTMMKVASIGRTIPEEELHKIFNLTFQIQKANEGGFKEDNPLALPICKEIIKAHNGKIWAESPSEGGAVFLFTLPCRTKIS